MLQITKEELKELMVECLSNVSTGQITVYDSEELAKKLKTNVATINYLRRDGFLTGVRIGKNWIYSEYNIFMFMMRNECLDLSSRERSKYEAKKRNVAELKGYIKGI